MAKGIKLYVIIKTNEHPWYCYSIIEQISFMYLEFIIKDNSGWIQK